MTLPNSGLQASDRNRSEHRRGNELYKLLTQALADVKAQASRLQAVIDAAGDIDFEHLQSVGDLGTRLATLESDDASVAAQLATLKAEVATLKAEMAHQKQLTTVFENRVAALEHKGGPSK